MKGCDDKEIKKIVLNEKEFWEEQFDKDNNPNTKWYHISDFRGAK